MRVGRVIGVLSVLAFVAGAIGVTRVEAQVPPSFGASVMLRCEPVTGVNCGQNVEPDIKVDGDGNAYVSVQAGVPGGANLYKRPVGDTKFHFMGMVDTLPAGLTEATGIAPGGGDTSLAIAPVKNAAGFHNVYVASLSAASTTLSTSRDGGVTFEKNYASTAPIFDVDRQWLAAEGAETLYQMYRDGNRVLWIQKSTDAGSTWSAPLPMVSDPTTAAVATNPAGTSSRFSNLHRDPVTGNLYLVFVNRATAEESVGANAGVSTAQRHRAWLAKCDASLACSVHDIYTDPDPSVRFDAVFPWVGTDASGRVYAAWTTTNGVFVATSTNGGTTFSTPVRADTPSPAGWKTVFPALVGGSAGRVGVAYLAAVTDSTDNAAAVWDVYYAFSADGGATFTQVKASDQPAHENSICLRGLQCDIDELLGANANRTLTEVVTIAIDADGMPIVAYPVSVRDGQPLSAGFSALVKQTGGDRLLAGVTTTPTQIEDTAGPVVFGPVAATTLHFDSPARAGNVDTARSALTVHPDPSMTEDAPSGAETKVQSIGTTPVGNRRFGANFLLAYFATGEPVKVQGAPTVELWLSSAGDGGVVPLRLGVQLFTAEGVADGDPHILYDGNPAVANKQPLIFDVTVGPTPTKVSLVLPAVDVEADTLIAQFSSQRGLADPTKAETATILYGSIEHDSTLSAPMAFAT